MVESIKEISKREALAFIMPRHYAGRKPQISVAFGWFVDNNLCAVITYGKPASNQLCNGICGKENSKNVWELNRMCRKDDFTLPLSHFVSKTLKMLSALNIIVVSYSDTAMNHHGYVYQACNFLYTGCTKERTDKYTIGNKHSRHYNDMDQCGARKVRSPKHRYVYFCTNSKKIRKQWLNDLKYPILPYPKGDNSNYILGEYMNQKIVGKINKINIKTDYNVENLF